MPAQEYNTARRCPLNQLRQLPALDVALFLLTCSTRAQAAIMRARCTR